MQAAAVVHSAAAVVAARARVVLVEPLVQLDHLLQLILEAEAEAVALALAAEALEALDLFV
jgi:hypothetical protein